jgi:hypothetical protein
MCIERWNASLQNSSTLLSEGEMVQDPQWMPKIANSIESYAYYAFPIHTHYDKI